ncbi:hypothetical protein AMECASPLE_032131 [Ameca splendens]|uniref:Uncharacterized protein n=1 Tax=Ameca splendens TaxID=208324 RepID=A0ABV0YTH3_9TELE
MGGIGSGWGVLVPVFTDYYRSQSITGQHGDTSNIKPCSHTLTPKGKIKSGQSYLSCFWTVEGSWSTQSEPMHAGGEHANSMQKDPWPGFKPRTTLLQGNSSSNCTTIHNKVFAYLS